MGEKEALSATEMPFSGRLRLWRSGQAGLGFGSAWREVREVDRRRVGAARAAAARRG